MRNKLLLLIAFLTFNFIQAQPPTNKSLYVEFFGRGILGIDIDGVSGNEREDKLLQYALDNGFNSPDHRKYRDREKLPGIGHRATGLHARISGYVPERYQTLFKIKDGQSR